MENSCSAQPKVNLKINNLYYTLVPSQIGFTAETNTIYGQYKKLDRYSTVIVRIQKKTPAIITTATR